MKIEVCVKVSIYCKSAGRLEILVKLTKVESYQPLFQWKKIKLIISPIELSYLNIYYYNN